MCQLFWILLILLTGALKLAWQAYFKITILFLNSHRPPVDAVKSEQDYIMVFQSILKLAERHASLFVDKLYTQGR